MVPASTPSAIFIMVSIDDDQTAAANPYGLSFALKITSSVVLNDAKQPTGPKISSRMIVASSATVTTTTNCTTCSTSSGTSPENGFECTTSENLVGTVGKDRRDDCASAHGRDFATDHKPCLWHHQSHHISPAPFNNASNPVGSSPPASRCLGIGSRARAVSDWPKGQSVSRPGPERRQS